MNCQASIPGPRGARGWDDSPVQPPNRPPQRRTLLLMAAAAFLLLLALSVGSAYLQVWWRSR